MASHLFGAISCQMNRATLLISLLFAAPGSTWPVGPPATGFAANRIKAVASPQHHGQHLPIFTGSNWNAGPSWLSHQPEFITSERERASSLRTGGDTRKMKMEKLLNRLTEPILLTLGSLVGRDQCAKRLSCKLGNAVPNFKFRWLVIMLMADLLPPSANRLLDGMKAKLILDDNCSRFTCFSFNS